MTHGGPKKYAFAPNDHQPWTLEEMQLVVDHECTDVELALKLGRSEQAVQTKRHYIHKYGMPRESDRTWAPRYDAAVDLTPATCCPGCYLALPKTGVCDDCG